MKKIALTLIIALVLCSGCYEFYFNDTPDSSITPQATPVEDIGEPIFEEPITIENLVVDNRNKTEKIDSLERVAKQKQKVLENIVAESNKIKNGVNAIKTIAKTTEPTTKPSIEPYLKTIGDSSDKINDLVTSPIENIVPIDIPFEPTPYNNIWESPKFWLGLIFGLLGVGLIVKFTFFKN
jgi:hypothetical protein